MIGSKLCIAVALLVTAGAPIAYAAAPAPAIPVPLIRENATVKLSPHVYAIPDGGVPVVPNIGFVVGSRATLVIDTGLGLRNGEAVMRELAKVSRNSEVYVATTHFHAEHTTGGTAFPAGWKFVRPRAQQQDIEEFGAQFFEGFRKRSPDFEQLMSGSRYPRADTLFDEETVLDLGGVKVRLIWLGPTHTRGDTVMFVEEDRVLFSGDIVMRNLFPAFSSPYSSAQAWLLSLNRLTALRPEKIVGAHGEIGDAGMIGEWRDYLHALQARVMTLKAQGVNADAAAEMLTKEFQARHPGWVGPVRIAPAVKTVYGES
jgi:glyoxylase-like metal-dependent hydrolase (beta-lactamase superfamily II)